MFSFKLHPDKAVYDGFKSGPFSQKLNAISKEFERIAEEKELQVCRVPYKTLRYIYPENGFKSKNRKKNLKTIMRGFWIYQVALSSEIPDWELYCAVLPFDKKTSMNMKCCLALASSNNETWNNRNVVMSNYLSDVVPFQPGVQLDRMDFEHPLFETDDNHRCRIDYVAEEDGGSGTSCSIDVEKFVDLVKQHVECFDRAGKERSLDRFRKKMNLNSCFCILRDWADRIGLQFKEKTNKYNDNSAGALREDGSECVRVERQSWNGILRVAYMPSEKSKFGLRMNELMTVEEEMPEATKKYLSIVEKMLALEKDYDSFDFTRIEG